MNLSIPLSICSIIGTAAMFAHPLLIVDRGASFRKTAFTGNVAWILQNISSNARLYLFDNCFLVAFICIVLFIGLLKYSKDTKRKIGAVAITGILALSGLCSLCNYFGDWSDTPLSIMTDGKIVALLSVGLLASIGLVLFFYLPKNTIKPDMFFFYFSVWIIAGMLSVVSPIGARTFMITYTFLTIIITRIWLSISKNVSVFFQILVPMLCLVFSVPYIFMLCNSYRTGAKVNTERKHYVEQQMELGAKKIIIPDSVNFTDCAGFEEYQFYYYYNEWGDIQFNSIPYNEWKTNYFIS